MNADSTNRVIDFEYFINKFNTKYYNKTRSDTDDSCRCRRNGITTCCDRYQTCKRSVEGHGNIRFFVSYPCDKKNSDSCNSCCKVCSYEDLTCTYDGIAFHADGRCTVESKPAEPEDEYT